jgi:hypothetical protein
VPVVQTTCHTVWTPICLKHHPSRRRELSVRTFPCVEKFRTAPACIRPNVFSSMSERLSVFDKLQDFFPKHSYGKLAATIRMTWIPVRTRSSIRQVSQFKSRRPDDAPHGPDERASDMEIVCIKSIVWTIISLVWTHEVFIWKLLAAEVRPSGRQGTIVRTRLKKRK